ncbi:MAG: hypothetical protein ACK5G0_01045 [Bacteroidota bacterium]|jgi:hypothetical protein
MSNNHQNDQTLTDRDRRMFEQICRFYYEKRLGGTCADLKTIRFVRFRGPHLIFRSKSDVVHYLKWSEYLAAKQFLLSSHN